MKKSLYVLFCCFLLGGMLILPVFGSAETVSEIEPMPDEFYNLLEMIPEDVRDKLPPSVFSDNSEEIGDGAREMSDFHYLLQTVLDLVGLKLGECAKMLALVCGILLLSAVCNAIKTSLRTESLGRSFSFLSSLIITTAILTKGFYNIKEVTAYFQTLSTITTALIPLMAGLYAMGGNVTAAVASTTGLSLYLTVIEQLIIKSIVPFCGICLAFAMMRSLDPALRLGTLSDTIKKNYTTFLAFLMMLLSGMLAAQNVLGAGKDSIAMRSAKFAAGNMIPVVGGSISELLRTVSTGVGYLRGTVGICAVILLLLTILPTLIELLLVRLTWQICASVADMLGCDSEKKLLDEMASLNGYLLAAVAICSSVVVLAISLFIHCTSAIG